MVFNIIYPCSSKVSFLFPSVENFASPSSTLKGAFGKFLRFLLRKFLKGMRWYQPTTHPLLSYLPIIPLIELLGLYTHQGLKRLLLPLWIQQSYSNSHEMKLRKRYQKSYHPGINLFSHSSAYEMCWELRYMASVKDKGMWQVEGPIT